MTNVISPAPQNRLDFTNKSNIKIPIWKRCWNDEDNVMKMYGGRTDIVLKELASVDNRPYCPILLWHSDLQVHPEVHFNGDPHLPALSTW
jgi:hypothetical protein